MDLADGLEEDTVYRNWPRIVTACHEAGHAVFLYNLLPLATVGRIEVPEEEKDWGEGFVEHFAKNEDRGPYFHAWHALAGRAAERIGAWHYCDGTVLDYFDTDPRDRTSYGDFCVAFRMLRPGLPVPPAEAMNDDTRITDELERVSQWLQKDGRWLQVHDLAEAIINNPKLSGEQVRAVLADFGPQTDSRPMRKFAIQDPYGINASYWATPADHRRDLLRRDIRLGPRRVQLEPFTRRRAQSLAPDGQRAEGEKATPCHDSHVRRDRSGSLSPL